MRFGNDDPTIGYGFLARRPGLGRCYGYLGYCLVLGLGLSFAVLPMWLRVAAPIVCLLLWLAAWWQQVGALYRQPLVAAFLIAAALLSGAVWTAEVPA